MLRALSLVLQYPVPPISYGKFPRHGAKSIIFLIDCKSQIEVLPLHSLQSTLHFPDAAWKIWLHMIRADPTAWKFPLPHETSWKLGLLNSCMLKDVPKSLSKALEYWKQQPQKVKGRKYCREALCSIHLLCMLSPVHGTNLFWISKETTNGVWNVHAYS